MSTHSRWTVINRLNHQKSLLQTKIANYNRHQLPQKFVFSLTRTLTQRIVQAFARLTEAIRGFERRLVTPYAGLLIIAVFVLIGNAANHQAVASQNDQTPMIADVAPEQVDQVLTALDPLTPDIAENPELVASNLIADDSAYLTRPGFSDMTAAEQSSKKDPIPYTVVQGDTLSTIARKNDRSVATILEANNIKPEDASKIVPGTQLFIPQEDTSNSLAWLDAENKAKADAAAERAKLLALAAQKRARLFAAAGISHALAAGLDDTKQVASGGFTGSASVNSFIVPIHYTVIARGVGHGHMGIDYDAPIGTAVHAAAAGRVIEITRGWGGGFGNSIVVDHGGGLTTRYAHLSQVQVGIGDPVSQGDQIALSGNTGNSTGPHMHFQTEINGRVISPF